MKLDFTCPTMLTKNEPQKVFDSIKKALMEKSNVQPSIWNTLIKHEETSLSEITMIPPEFMSTSEIKQDIWESVNHNL